MKRALTSNDLAALFDYVQRSEGSVKNMGELMDASSDLVASDYVHIPDCDNGFIADYRKYRSRGFSIEETAYLLGVSANVLYGMLTGSFVTREQHRRLVECEATARLGLENELLDVVLESAQNVPANAIKALEMLFPEKYKLPSANINISANVETPEQKALRAQEELRQARMQREPIDL